MLSCVPSWIRLFQHIPFEIDWLWLKFKVKTVKQKSKGDKCNTKRLRFKVNVMIKAKAKVCLWEAKFKFKKTVQMCSLERKENSVVWAKLSFFLFWLKIHVIRQLIPKNILNKPFRQKRKIQEYICTPQHVVTPLETKKKTKPLPRQV